MAKTSGSVRESGANARQNITALSDRLAAYSKKNWEKWHFLHKQWEKYYINKDFSGMKNTRKQIKQLNEEYDKYADMIMEKVNHLHDK